MNNWVYLILIAVLAILAVVMLYSRFSARSREKSFHHAPARIVFPAETISAAAMDERESAPAASTEEGVFSLSRINSEHHEKSGPEIPRTEAAKSPESDYLDELQEAAAGLALLMRSSPVGKVAPVIFAPDVNLAETGVELVEGGSGIDEADDCVIADPAVPASTIEPASDPVGEEIVPVSKILGEQVIEIVERIDFELDALETLVAGIEASIVALGGAVHPESDRTAERERESRVFEAA